jgi:hypothetical protein
MRGTLQSWSLAVAAAAFVHAPPRSSAVRLAAPAAHPRAVCALIIADSTLEEHFRFGLDIVEKAPSLASTIPEVLHDPEVLELLAESDAYLRPVTEYLRPSAQQTLRLALEVALIAHHGQRRRSGEAYITHPVAVAHILATSNMERATVVSGLLHDTVEDTSLTFDEIEALFGFTVRRIVEGETKVSKLPKMVRSHLDEEALHSHANFEKPTSKVEEQVEVRAFVCLCASASLRVRVCLRVCVCQPLCVWHKRGAHCTCGHAEPLTALALTPSHPPVAYARCVDHPHVRTCAQCSSRWRTTGASSWSSSLTGCTTCAR